MSIYRWSIYIALVVFSVVLSCRRNQVDALPSLTDVDTLLTDADTLPPKILRMSIPGISDGNVQIDQVHRKVIVTLPKDYLVRYGTGGITFALTPDATWVRGFAPTNINFCDGFLYQPGPITAEDLQYNNKDLLIQNGLRKKTYRLVIMPAGEMAFAKSDLTYEVTTESPQYSLPSLALYNYTDSSGHSDSKVVFTHQSTGEQISGDAYSCFDSNRVYFSLPPLRLGTHTIYIQKANGRKTTNSLRLIVKAGVPAYYGFTHSLLAILAKGIIVSTQSAFEGSDYEVEIWHRRTGERYRIKPVRISPYGNSIHFSFPTGIKSGYYYSRMYVDGKPLSTHMTSIYRDADQPGVFELTTPDASNPDVYKNAFNALTDETIHLKRGKEHGLVFSPMGQLPMQVSLQSVAQPDKAYAFGVTVPESYGSDAAVFEKPYFVPPADLPPGRYLFRLQYKGKDGSINVGEPLERDVVVE